jgi:N-carbamoyl-L-amino-acid hydrolase
MHGLAPSAMIFVPCRRGISHHEAEWAEPEHLAAGARVLATLLLEASVGEADFARLASNDARVPGGIRNAD